jgi:hypothetical protein
MADLAQSLAISDQATGGDAPATVVGPDDPRYRELTTAANDRFRCHPRQVLIAQSATQVVHAVQAAVDVGARVAVRSGGHCLEDFVDSARTEVLIDLSELNRVGFDAQRGAFFVEAGALLGPVYRALLKGWGVTIPAGLEATVGVGGHILGGGYGPLTRRHGSAVDHLYAVEVVVVDRSGTARAVVATREPTDPHQDLWWAHTGGGGGNFGVVTRYWFRSPGVRSDDPSDLLPRPPAEVLDSLAFWPWPEMTAESFRRLLHNHQRWHEHNSAPDSPYTSLFSILTVMRRQTGMLGLTTQVDAAHPHAERLLREYLSALTDGVATAHTHDVQTRPWLQSMIRPRMAGNVWGLRAKCKAAYLRKAFHPDQIDILYRRMTAQDYDNPGAGLIFTAYGGQASAVAPDATASAQRDSVLKVFYLNTWTDSTQDDRHVAWVRDFYREVYAGTGGVPVPGLINDGSYINYPDTDLADPEWNTSGTPWHALYYKDNYPRLQRVKQEWDPLNVFTHQLSIEPPG